MNTAKIVKTGKTLRQLEMRISSTTDLYDI